MINQRNLIRALLGVFLLNLTSCFGCGQPGDPFFAMRTATAKAKLASCDAALAENPAEDQRAGLEACSKEARQELVALDPLSYFTSSVSEKLGRTSRAKKKKKKGKTQNLGPTPTQEQVNATLSTLGSLFTALEGFSCITSCTELSELIAIAGTSPCSVGGKITIDADECTSSDALPVTLKAKNCNNGDAGVINGNLNVSIAASSSKSVTTLSTDKISLFGYNYAYQNFKITLPCSGGIYGAAKCSGTVKAGSASCKIASSCDSCPLP